MNVPLWQFIAVPLAIYVLVRMISATIPPIDRDKK